MFIVQYLYYPTVEFLLDLFLQVIILYFYFLIDISSLPQQQNPGRIQSQRTSGDFLNGYFPLLLVLCPHLSKLQKTFITTLICFRIYLTTLYQIEIHALNHDIELNLTVSLKSLFCFSYSVIQIMFDELLPAAYFSHNSAVVDHLHMSPFKMDLRWNPTYPVDCYA